MATRKSLGKIEWLEFPAVLVERSNGRMSENVMVRRDMVNAVEGIFTGELGPVRTRLHLCFANGSFVDVGTPYKKTCKSIYGAGRAPKRVAV